MQWRQDLTLSYLLSSALEDDEECFLGAKTRATDFLPSRLGPDNQVDMVFARKWAHRSLRNAVVPIENKVSWNFPGGSLTSNVQDYARLGRDVRLYDLVPELPVASLADGKSDETQGRTIKNRSEGEFDDGGMPDVSTAGAQQARRIQKQLQDAQYVMSHKVFPVRQIVSYMLSLRARYGIL